MEGKGTREKAAFLGSGVRGVGFFGFRFSVVEIFIFRFGFVVFGGLEGLSRFFICLVFFGVRVYIRFLIFVCEFFRLEVGRRGLRGLWFWEG